MSETAVRKAIRAGRISVNDDGTIDPDQADRQWDNRTDPAMQRGAAARRKGNRTAAATAATGPEVKAVPGAALKAVDETLAEGGGAGPIEGSAPAFMRARTANEVLKVKIQQERLKEMRGETIDRQRAAAMVFDLARRERDAWMGWPARVAANMAAELEVDVHLMEQVLERYLREHLAEMAEIKVELR